MSSKYQKVVFEYPVREIHGKPCSHTNTYFAINGFTKEPYISKLCYPSTTVTAGMLAQRNLFRDASAYAKTQMTDATKRAAAEVRSLPACWRSVTCSGTQAITPRPR